MRIVCQTGAVVETDGPLRGAVLHGINLHRAILERASFEETLFESCDLRSALFALSSGSHARFVDCTLILVGFQAANLSGVRIDGGDLYGSDFSGANLTGATLAGVRLAMATFQGANLDRADLTEADVEGALFEGAIYSPETRWPRDFDAAASGAVLVADQTEVFKFLDDASTAEDRG